MTTAVAAPITGPYLSRQTGWVLVATSLVALVCLYAWVVLTNPEILGLDARINDLATRGALPGSGRALAAMSEGTNPGPLTVASLAVAAGVGVAFSVRRAAVFASMIGLSALTVTILKEVVARTRPEAGADALASFAWPSGHSAGAFTFALAVTLALYRIGPRPGLVAAVGFMPAALLVGYSRIFLSVHWFLTWRLGLRSRSLRLVWSWHFKPSQSRTIGTGPSLRTEPSWWPLVSW